jgi:uncharacterized RDD family membrane protein YckC
MNELLTFLPLIFFIGVGLLLIIPIIKRDRKQSSSYKIHHNYASFWLRLLAFFIDFIIVSIIFSLIRVVIDFKLKQEYIVADYGLFVLYRGPIVILIAWLYFAILESSKLMATIGKLIVGIKVTNLLGKKITIWNATGRYFGKFASSLFLCMGFIMIFFMSTKQGLHDDWAQTVVIKKKLLETVNSQTGDN